MMDHGMGGMSATWVLVVLLVAILVLTVTATVWLIWNMMGSGRADRARIGSTTPVPPD